MSKLADFLQNQKIDTRQLLAASKRSERFQISDRAIRLAKLAVKNKKANEAQTELAGQKGRSGKKLSINRLQAALSGEAKLNSATKRKILNAVNAVQSMRKKDSITSADLFE